MPGGAVEDSRRVVVFLKAPRPGEVKTRLAADLDPPAAAAIYRVLVERTLAVVAGAWQVELRYAPDDAREEIAPWLRPGWRGAAQGGGDLGVRLERAVSDAMGGGVNRVVLVGTDCPELGTADIEEAWRDLELHDVVLGPATDGGYWLIGLRRRWPELFRDIPWSTDRVLATTRARAAGAGLRLALLRERADVDTLEDWRRWLRGGAGLAPAAGNC